MLTFKPNGKSLPVSTEQGTSVGILLLGILLTPLIHIKFTEMPNGKVIRSRIVLRTTRQQIAKYWDYIN